MRSLLLLTKKNLKLLVRSKTSALVIFFAPLMIILLLGLSYNNTSKYGLNIGIYAPVFSDDVNSLMVSLQEQEFKIIKYESSVDDCVKDIKEGIVHTCLSVPESLKIDGNQQKEITFYVDPSKINLVWMIQETLGNKFNLKSKEISKELSNNILTTVSDTKTKLDEQNSQLSGVKEKSSAATTSAQTAVQQLTTLETGHLFWRGEIWSGQPMEWDIYEHSQEKEKENESDQVAQWRTQLRLSMPQLGDITATITLNG
ncbi:MAG: hypothetical protein AABX05_05825, partial [Nanoarchaeota archaeon]